MRLAPQLAALLLGVTLLSGHVGTNDVVLDGNAGPYPLRVVVRPAGVVPGLAQITVRVLGEGVTAVSVQAAPSRFGMKGAPRPDVLEQVAGEKGLYHAELWLMTTGAYTVRVMVDGREGRGELIVPVQSLATRRLPMGQSLGWILAALGILLAAGAVTIVRSAVGHAIVPTGSEPDDAARRTGHRGMLVSALVLAAIVTGGWAWWKAEDAAYRRSIDRPLTVLARTIHTDSGSFLEMSVVDSAWVRVSEDALIPDHGKMMHLFVISRSGLASIAHLHPMRRDERTFITPLPALPAGEYQVFGDVVHESGLARTLTAVVRIDSIRQASLDPDDSWFTGSSIAGTPASAGSLTHAMGDGFTMTWERAGSTVAGPEGAIRVVVSDARGQPVELEPYMGMRGHAMVMRDDASVFVHLHPAGTISMAAQQRMSEGLDAGHGVSHSMGEEQLTSTVRFPFAFPTPGRYRVWVQVKIDGVVRTAAFDTTVEPGG
jgi:hypothetical protein